MAYQRKTHDEWHVQGNYGESAGWETLTIEETREEAEQMLKDYNDNETMYPHRIRKVRKEN